MKNVTSRDERKPTIVALIKQKSGGSKVTMVKELKDGGFQGDVLSKVAGQRSWKRMGTYKITLAEFASEWQIRPM